MPAYPVQFVSGGTPFVSGGATFVSGGATFVSSGTPFVSGGMPQLQAITVLTSSALGNVVSVMPSSGSSPGYAVADGQQDTKTVVRKKSTDTKSPGTPVGCNPNVAIGGNQNVAVPVQIVGMYSIYCIQL